MNALPNMIISFSKVPVHFSYALLLRTLSLFSLGRKQRKTTRNQTISSGFHGSGRRIRILFRMKIRTFLTESKGISVFLNCIFQLLVNLRKSEEILVGAKIGAKELPQFFIPLKSQNDSISSCQRREESSLIESVTWPYLSIVKLVVLCPKLPETVFKSS